mmetsp:Transcript_105533/g.296978  ORF Transcript_105533/g.296978 Transcript_105533/m.296978 type:complete len:305 (-) Transcript_105533:99-1013(-)
MLVWRHSLVSIATLASVSTCTDLPLVSPLRNDSASWAMPARVTRCPMHDPFGMRADDAGGFWLVPPGGGKFSVTEAALPTENGLSSSSTGLRLRYSANPDASGVSLWRLRVRDERHLGARFVTLFSVPPEGVTNKTQYFPWSDFRGQLIDFAAKKIIECGASTDENCTMWPERMTHISFLESEDTVAHAIWLHELVVVHYEIADKNETAHHTEEDEARLFDREHKMLQGHERDRDGSEPEDDHDGSNSTKAGPDVLGNTSSTSPPDDWAGVAGSARELKRGLWGGDVAVILFLVGRFFAVFHNT